MKRFPKIMVVLLVLAYAGQALATTALSCSSMAPVANAAMDMAHAGHHMSAGDLDSGAGDAGCCDSGLCSMSQCQAAPAVLSAALAGSAAYAETYAQRVVHSSPTRPSYSLFKPPISL
jgi:hypothetical protein